MFRGFFLAFLLGWSGVFGVPAHALSLRVGIPALAPDIYLQDDGRPAGILADILEEIASREHWQIQPEFCHWADCMRRLHAGTLDLLPSVTYTAEGARLLDFHRTPVLSRHQFDSGRQPLYTQQDGFVTRPRITRTDEIFYAVPRGRHAAVLDALDRYLQVWKSDHESVYYQILNRWGHSEALVPWYSHTLFVLALSVLSCFALAFAWLQRGRSRLFIQRLRTSEQRFRATLIRQEEIREKLHHMSFFDELTQLPNRRMAMHRIDEVLAALRKKPYPEAALIFIDLDGFGNANETLGQPAGDQVLFAIARRLLANTAALDSVARANGDEFMILVTGVADSSEAVDKAEKLRLSIYSEPVMIDDSPFSLSASIGLTMLTADSGTAEDVVRDAKIACHHASSLGGNRLVLFNPDIRRQIEYRVTLEQDLGAAIRASALELYIQPQYNCNREPTGAELLSRWTHPVHGSIPPGIFIPLARAAGLLRPLTKRVFIQACDIVTVLQGRDERYPVSINVSPETLRDPAFIRCVRETLSLRPEVGGQLVFELTEDIRVENMNATVGLMRSLNVLGIRFSLDDFGCGYSNLAYLRYLPVHELKIDKTLIEGLPDRAESRALIELIVALALNLNLRLVAEGVETQAQADYLFEQGCQAIQGYLWAHPVPIAQWLARSEAALLNA